MNACVACGPTRSLAEGRGSALRRQFRAHANYPDQTLLLGSHDNFRRISRELVERAREREDGWRLHVELVFRLWHRAMAGHEGYEEHKLYPYLARRFRSGMEVLVDDHEALHEKRDEVLKRLAAAHEVDDDAHDAAALAALEAYDAALDEHLDREEAMVIPLLLSMEREEFTRYTEGSIGALLADLPPCET